MSRRMILLVAAMAVPACSADGEGDGARDLRAVRSDDLGFELEPDLAHEEDLAEPEDLTTPPDLRVTPQLLSFAAPVVYGTDRMPDGLVAVDLNRDNHIDIAVATHQGNGLAVLLGVGDGTFRAPVTYNVGSLSYGVATGDFNGDGKPDLCSASV